MISKRKILIIGAGIQGTFIALELKKLNKNLLIDLIDENAEILSGSSASTHNRANRGYHYPRSLETQKECSDGRTFFIKNYKNCYQDIGVSYYAIHKDSKVTKEKYEFFLKKSNLKYKIRYPDGCENLKKNTTQSFEGYEGCFNHEKLKKKLIKKIYKKINFIKNFKLVKVKFEKRSISLFSNSGKVITSNYNTIINTTYSDSSNILKIFGIKPKDKYTIQHTIIPIVKTKEKIPGITIMDGPFVTIMPRSGYKNHYLLYDVVNSNSKNLISETKKKILIKKIISRVNLLISKNFNFKVVGSLIGKRPILLKNSKTDKRTRVFSKNIVSNKKIFTITEGKYISAPLLAKQFVTKYFNDHV